MSASKKSHKAMADTDWLARLQAFANTGVWPSSEGNRPAPRQKKWHELYNKIQKCPQHLKGQSTLVGGLPKCVCSFHKERSKNPLAPQPSTSTASLSTSPSTSPAKRPKLTLSMFERSRYGGTHVATAKPNLNVTRKHVQPQEIIGAGSTSCQSPGPQPSTSFHPHRPLLQSPCFLAPPPQPQPAEQRQHSAESSVVMSMPIHQPENTAELPLLWPQTLPWQDQKWVSEALFRLGPKGKLELRDNLQLWYHAPPPALLYHQSPTPDRFFSQSLLLWMPYRLWKVRLYCTNPDCKHRLSGGGLHRRVRQVLDIDRYYNLVTETLICSRCRSSYVSWSQTILHQLDLAHRSEFRVILTRRYACDIRVIRLLRERGLGNGPVRIIGQLKETHSEQWLQRAARYVSECAAFMENASVLPPQFQEPPEPATVPSYKWLLTVYSQDILNRLEEIKAGITSTYGAILKMDSTKKITKKLTGPAKGTAQWLTSVGNEKGQEVGETKLKTRFSGWPDVIVRLDIWHFMRRLATGCTTDAHQLYPTFMSRLAPHPWNRFTAI
ncbi:uncharacterized protein LOC143519694 isoform X3 [Brachyhypopomus gauderio]|uniref:uncharacterized protein LOC143519694 isoform X3 n=1 Tax=Brachyhypopomus gauderio TaxID=698409 RepID=UPI0040429D76